MCRGAGPDVLSLCAMCGPPYVLGAYVSNRLCVEPPYVTAYVRSSFIRLCVEPAYVLDLLCAGPTYALSHPLCAEPLM